MASSPSSNPHREELARVGLRVAPEIHLSLTVLEPFGGGFGHENYVSYVTVRYSG